MRPKIKKTSTIIAGILVLTTVSCKDNSTNSSDVSIVITNVTQSIVELNGCDIGSGPMASEFLFDIEYEASEEIDIDGIEFDLNWSSGDQDNNVFVSQFNATNVTADFDWCFRYGAEEQWFELNLKIIAENERAESNEFKIRVDRPEGANKSLQ
jgi:hypothetical protein